MTTHRHPRHNLPLGAERRAGAIAAQMVLCLTAILLFLTLLFDGGNLLSERRRAQAAADSAALAGADNLFLEYPVNQGQDTSGTAAAAQASAAANGYSNDGVTTTVTVNIPPKSGPFQDATQYPGYIEVIIQTSVSRIFSSQPETVVARSVARGQWGPTSTGLLLLDPIASGALSMGGNSSLIVTGGASLVVNSSSGGAASISSSNGVTVASPGQVKINGGWSGSISPTPVHAEPMPDPLRFLPAPSPSAMSTVSQSLLTVGGTQSLSPGLYVGGIAIPGSGTVTFQPGVYYLQGGGLNISGSANIVAKGVVICNGPDSLGNVGPLVITGGGSLTFTAPTTGPWSGVCFYQPRGATMGIGLNGNGNLVLGGTLYAPGANVTINGISGATVTAGQVVCDSLTMSGKGTLNINWNPKQVGPARMLNLVE